VKIEILQIIFGRFSKINNVNILEASYKNRLGIVAFIVKDAHYNLVIKILNDKVWCSNKRRLFVCRHLWTHPAAR
jgi:selenocysteine lyase/cysteine desulfurase